MCFHKCLPFCFMSELFDLLDNKDYLFNHYGEQKKKGVDCSIQFINLKKTINEITVMNF